MLIQGLQGKEQRPRSSQAVQRERQGFVGTARQKCNGQAQMRSRQHVPPLLALPTTSSRPLLTAPSSTTMPTIGSSITQKTKQERGGGDKGQGGSLKNGRHRDPKGSGQQAVSVFAPIVSAKSVQQTDNLSRQNQSTEKPRGAVGKERPVAPLRQEGARSNEQSTYKSVMAVNYLNNQSSRNRRPLGRGRHISSFKADANVMKKDISDSNIFDGSEDEPDLQNQAIDSKDNDSLKQSSPGSPKSHSSSGLIHDELPISLVMDSRNHGSTSQGLFTIDKHKFISQKIRKVGMSGINADVGSERAGAPVLAARSRQMADEFRSGARTQREQPAALGATLSLFDRGRPIPSLQSQGHSLWQYKTTDMPPRHQRQRPSNGLQGKGSAFQSFEPRIL